MKDISVPSTYWDRINREWFSSKRAILAYHMGGWRKGESPQKALARALEVASENKLLNLTDTYGLNELILLSTCLEMDLNDLSELSISESVDFTIALLNEKLGGVPLEVRAFFGAPQRLEPLPTNIRGQDRLFPLH